MTDDRAGAGPGELYLLVLGLTVGLLLGPWVFGRALPGVYERWVRGVPGLLQAQLEQATLHYEESRATLEAIDVTDVAIRELGDAHVARTQPIVAEIADAVGARAQRVRGWLAAIVVAVAVAAAVEAAVLGPLQRRLATARYALLAAWIALAMALPEAAAPLPWGFALLLAAVAIVAALVPLRRRRVQCPHEAA